MEQLEQGKQKKGQTPKTPKQGNKQPITDVEEKQEKGFMIMKQKFELIINEKWCKLCGLCIRFCPVKNLKISEKKIKVGKKCTGCKLCEIYCPDFSIEVKNETN